jgi:DNA-binding NarL/FixJ family response regulator
LSAGHVALYDGDVAIRIVVADDHPLILEALTELFDSEPDFTVLASCRTGEEALAALGDHTPDVLVLDLRMPGMGGLGVLRALANRSSAPRVTLYTVGLDVPEMSEALGLGVRGVVLKEMPPSTLIDCVRAVHSGVTWLDDARIYRSDVRNV